MRDLLAGDEPCGSRTNPYVSGPGYGYGPRYPYYRSRFAYQRHYWNPYRYYPNRWRG
jgi:hypothetical protein